MPSAHEEAEEEEDDDDDNDNDDDDDEHFYTSNHSSYHFRLILDWKTGLWVYHVHNEALQFITGVNHEHARNVEMDLLRFAQKHKTQSARVLPGKIPASILRKSTSGRHRPVSYPDGPMTARYRFT